MDPKREDLMIDDMYQSQEEETENENDYKIWKKNAPYLYDVLITWGLDWPSLCVNWLPKVDYLKERPFYLQKLVIGTNTSGQEPDYLMIAKARLPISKVVIDTQPPYNNLTKEFNEHGDWGLGIGDWGLGIGPNPQSPIPNPQSPNPQSINRKVFQLYLNY